MASKHARILKLINNITVDNEFATITAIRSIKAERDFFIRPHLILSSIEEPFICSLFACNRALSITEQLYGSRCQLHSVPDKVDITKLLKIK